MSKFFKMTIYTALIVCYGFVATVGNVITLRELLNSGDKQHQHLTSEKKSRSIPDSPVSIAKSHVIPSFESGQSFHLTTSNDISIISGATARIVDVEIVLICATLEFLPSKPRDPPLA